MRPFEPNKKYPKLRVAPIHYSRQQFRLSANFQVSPGERVALKGPSGSGKTTLLRILAGLEDCKESEIYLGDLRLDRLPVHKREIGFVFQDQSLFSALTVFENVAFGLKMRGMGLEERLELSTIWLKKMGLAEKIDAPIQELSGGERQRVALIRAVIWKPKLLLLDEPFTGLDPSLRTELRNQLVELHETWPVPLILVTHDLEDCQTIATKTWTLEKEQLADGTQNSLLTQA